VLLRGGDEEPVELVPMNGRQQGGARGKQPADRQFVQAVKLIKSLRFESVEKVADRESNRCPLAKRSQTGYIEFATKDTLTVTQGQAQFPALCRKEKTSAITRNGEVVAFVVPRKRMARLLEQMEILANPEAMAAILRAKTGRTVDHPLSVLDED
jgi:hypothetical protein